MIFKIFYLKVTKLDIQQAIEFKKEAVDHILFLKQKLKSMKKIYKLIVNLKKVQK